MLGRGRVRIFRGFSFFQVPTLEQLLHEFENHGCVNLKLLEHTVKRGDNNASMAESNAKICFALDPPKERKKQKAGQTLSRALRWGTKSSNLCQVSNGNPLTFGAKMDLAKIRTANNVVIAWRLRLFISTSHVSSLSCSMSSWLRLHLEPSQPETLVPVRPTCLLAGDIDLPDDKAIQIL